MFIQLVRLKDDGRETIGTLYINGTFECFTLEDTYNEPKVYGRTRIPSGDYDIKLRTEGGMTGKYSNKFPFHKGMLWLQNVNDFKYVYIHIGNNEDDTDGCILLGNTADITNDRMSVGGSALAYVGLYPKIAKAIEDGEEVTIQIV